MVRKYRKAIAGFIGAAVSAAIPLYLNDDTLSSADWWAVLIAALGTLGVVAVSPPNRPTVPTTRRSDIP